MTRNAVIDAIKALAIICVVVGHCIQYGCGSNYLDGESYFDNLLYKCIYGFHMPLFMLISGYLFGNSIRKGRWYDAVVKRYKLFIPPILIWTLVPFWKYIQYFYSFNIEFPSIKEMLFQYGYTCIHVVWFLWAILLCVTVVSLVRRYLRDSIFVYIAGFCLTFLTPDFFNFSLYKFVYPFFIIGYLFNTKYFQVKNVLMDSKCVLLVSSLIYCVMMMFIYSKETYVYVSGHTIIQDNGLSIHQFINDVIRFITGLSGCTSIIIIIQKMYSRLSNYVKMTINVIATNTLGIYLLSGHLIECCLTNISEGLNGFNIFVVLLEAILITGISLCLSLLLKKTKVLKRLLIGA